MIETVSETYLPSLRGNNELEDNDEKRAVKIEPQLSHVLESFKESMKKKTMKKIITKESTEETMECPSIENDPRRLYPITGYIRKRTFDASIPGSPEDARPKTHHPILKALN